MKKLLTATLTSVQQNTKCITTPQLLQSHQRALAIRIKVFGEEHERTADSYFSVGVTQYIMMTTPQLSNLISVHWLSVLMFLENYMKGLLTATGKSV